MVLKKQNRSKPSTAFCEKEKELVFNNEVLGYQPNNALCWQSFKVSFNIIREGWDQFCDLYLPRLTNIFSRVSSSLLPQLYFSFISKLHRYFQLPWACMMNSTFFIVTIFANAIMNSPTIFWKTLELELLTIFALMLKTG